VHAEPPAWRRAWIVVALVLVVVAAPGDARAQASKPARLGLLSPDGTFADTSPLLAAFRQGLAERGWVEGRNVTLIRRDSGGEAAYFLGNALLALGVDLIVAASTLGARVARDATSTVPIVFVGVSDPVASGLLARLVPPRGTNLTGFIDVDVRSSARALALLKQAAPTITRVALLADPRAPLAAQYVAEVEATARALGVIVHRRHVRGADELPAAFAAILEDYDQALVVLPHPVFSTVRQPLIAFAAQHRLPAVYAYRAFAAEGGFMTYGTDVADLYRRAAGVVDRILKGTAPGDLPIERPTKFYFVINLRAARGLRVTITDALRAQADHLIQ
jgi:putative ABC transport system substrate-binding protein